MAEGGASTGGGGAGAAVVKEGKLFKRGEVMMLVVFVHHGDVEVGVDVDRRVVDAVFIERQTLQGGEN